MKETLDDNGTAMPTSPKSRAMPLIDEVFTDSDAASTKIAASRASRVESGHWEGQPGVKGAKNGRAAQWLPFHFWCRLPDSNRPPHHYE
jgi:hypothetical protein